MAAGIRVGRITSLNADRVKEIKPRVIGALWRGRLRVG